MIKRNTYISSSLMYTSDIPTLNYSTDYDKLCVSVYKATAEYDVIFTTDLCAVDGKVNIYDIRPLVEQFMRDKGMTYLEFNIDVENKGGEEVLITAFKVLYCRYSPSELAGNLGRFHFLTSQGSKVVHYESCFEEELCFFEEKGKEVCIEETVLYTSVNGELQTKRYNYSYVVENSGAEFAWIDFYDIWSDVGGDEGAVLHSVTYRVNDRMFTYYLEFKEADILFGFNNAFNVRETMTLCGKTTTVLKRDKNEAVCGGVTQYYDCTYEKLYEFESERLTPVQMQWVEEMLTSDAVYYNNATSYRVIITDFTYEVADDDTEKFIAKFTWKYADNRLAMPLDSKRNARVFTTQFDKTFQ